MNRTIAVCVILVWIAVCVCIAAARPQWLSDSNEYLRSFMQHEFLEFMGVVVTITLASCANLFIELNKLEERLGGSHFPESKRHVRDSAFALIGALVASVALTILKPIVINGERSEVAVHGIAILIVIVSVMILIDLTVAAFHFEPPIIEPRPVIEPGNENASR
jgi:hypothetical protein